MVSLQSHWIVTMQIFQPTPHTSSHRVNSQFHTQTPISSQSGGYSKSLTSFPPPLRCPVFCEPLVYLFNKSLATSVVPRQWKQTSIRPVPKTATPLNHSDYRPISIALVLSRTLERIVVREFLYPAILDPPMPLSYGDQFAFRPTGSTTAALIALMQTITDLLTTNSFVCLTALDFSKAFDTVRHDTLLSKMVLLNILDVIYNRLADFFQDHEHCTKIWNINISDMVHVSANIIQGSAIGPVSYDINASDVSTVTPGNLMYKYADDTYLVIPTSNAQSRKTEVNHVAEWARKNNLKLNRVKSVEVIFNDRKRKQQIKIYRRWPTSSVSHK